MKSARIGGANYTTGRVLVPAIALQPGKTIIRYGPDSHHSSSNEYYKVVYTEEGLGAQLKQLYEIPEKYHLHLKNDVSARIYFAAVQEVTSPNGIPQVRLHNTKENPLHSQYFTYSFFRNPVNWLKIVELFKYDTGSNPPFGPIGLEGVGIDKLVNCLNGTTGTTAAYITNENPKAAESPRPPHIAYGT